MCATLQVDASQPWGHGALGLSDPLSGSRAEASGNL